MKRVLLAAGSALLLAAPVLAGDDPMSGFYGNTAVVTGGMAETHSHYRADHTFDITAHAMGMDYKFAGTWKFDAKGQLCRTYADPTPPGLPSNPLCTPWEAHKVGDTWTTTTNGSTRTITLKAGVE
jgi:opacity protein-like surface antigen